MKQTSFLATVVFLFCILATPAAGYMKGFTYYDNFSDSELLTNPSWSRISTNTDVKPFRLNATSSPSKIWINQSSYLVQNGIFEAYIRQTRDAANCDNMMIHMFFYSNTTGGVPGYGYAIGYTAYASGYKFGLSRDTDSVNPAAWTVLNFTLLAGAKCIKGDTWHYWVMKNGSKFKYNLTKRNLNGSFSVQAAGTATDATYTSKSVNGIGFWFQYANYAYILNVSYRNLTEPANNMLVSSFFMNESHRVKKSVFKEGEAWYGYANVTWSMNASPISGAMCNITFFNMSREKDAYDNDFTVCSSGCDFVTFNQTFQRRTLTAYKDAVHFRACYPQITSTLNTTVRYCNQTFKVSPAQVPLCSNGYAFIFLNTSKCVSAATIKVNITHPTLANRRISINDLGIDRFFSSYPDIMEYNASDRVFKSNHTFEAYTHGIVKYVTNCSQGLTKKGDAGSVTIVNRLPVIRFNEVITPTSEQAISNGMVIEYAAGYWYFFVSVDDDDLDSIRWNITNGTHLVWKNFSKVNAIPRVQGYRLVEGEPTYTFTIRANDSNKNKTTASFTFRVNDSLIPTITIVRPASGQHIDVRQANVTRIDVLFADENLYGYWCNISDSLGNRVWSDSNTSLSGLTFKNFTNVTDLAYRGIDIYTLYCRVCDGHTDIDMASVETKERADGVLVDSVLIRSESAIKEASLEKLPDRYSFAFSYPKPVSYDSFLISGDDHVTIIPGSKYLGHVVIDDRYWSDFEGLGVDSVDLEQVGSNLVRATAYYKLPLALQDGSSDAEVLQVEEFNSIGSLNCRDTSLVFDVRNATAPYAFERFTCDMTTTPKAIGLMGILFFMLILWLAQFWLKIPIYSLFLGFVWLWSLTWNMAACFEFASMLFVMMGVISLVVGVYYGVTNATHLGS